MEIAWLAGPVGLAGISAFLFGRRFCPPMQYAARLLVWLILFSSFLLLPVHVSATLEMLGVLGEVSLSSILFLAALPPAVLLLCRRATPDTAAPSSKFTDACRAVLELPLYVKVTTLIVAASYAVFAVNQPMAYDFAWDGHAYHLPMVVDWLQKHSLAIAPSEDWKSSLPANAEIGMMFLLASGLQRVASAFNIVALGVAVCAIYLVAARISHDKAAGLLAAFLFVSLPIVQFQAFSGYVDLFGACFIIGGVAAFVFRVDPDVHEPQPRRYIVMVAVAGLAWGIAIGTKPTLFGYVGLCYLGVFLVIWRERQKHHRSVVMIMAILSFAMLLPSYFWFLRALVATGNPLYPITVNLFGVTLLEGFSVNHMMKMPEDLPEPFSKLDWLSYSWVEFTFKSYPFYSHDNGVGAIWATFVPLGLLYGVFQIIRNVDDRDFRQYAYLMIFMIVMIFLWWFGLRKIVRFALPWLALACILASPLFNILARRQLRIFRPLLILSAVTSTSVTALTPAHSLLGLIRTGEWKERALVLNYPAELDRLPDGAVVWNAGAHETRNFSLAGARLSNKVIRRPWKGMRSAKAFIAQNSIDYVVETNPYCCQGLKSIGAQVLLDRKVGPLYRWRIWRIMPTETKANIQ